MNGYIKGTQAESVEHFCVTVYVMSVASANLALGRALAVLCVDIMVRGGSYMISLLAPEHVGTYFGGKV